MVWVGSTLLLLTLGVSSGFSVSREGRVGVEGEMGEEGGVGEEREVGKEKEDKEISRLDIELFPKNVSDSSARLKQVLKIFLRKGKSYQLKVTDFGLSVKINMKRARYFFKNSGLKIKEEKKEKKNGNKRQENKENKKQNKNQPIPHINPHKTYGNSKR